MRELMMLMMNRIVARARLVVQVVINSNEAKQTSCEMRAMVGFWREEKGTSESTPRESTAEFESREMRGKQDSMMMMMVTIIDSIVYSSNQKTLFMSCTLAARNEGAKKNMSRWVGMRGVVGGRG